MNPTPDTLSDEFQAQNKGVGLRPDAVQTRRVLTCQQLTYHPAARTLLTIMKRLLGIAALALALGACGQQQSSSQATVKTVPGMHTSATKKAAERRVTYTSSCQATWPVVFQTSPPRLVSEVTVHNRGNVVTHVRVWTDWFYFGGGSAEKVAPPIVLRPGQSRRVAVGLPVSVANLERMAGWKHGDRMCRTHALIIIP